MSFQLDPEFIRTISKACADMIIDGELELVPNVWSVETIGKVEVVDIQTINIDLEALSSSELGWTDPLGQLKQFFTDLINSVVSWLSETIGGAVKGFIDWLWEQISPSLNSIASWIEEATSQLQGVGTAITGFINAILKFPDWFPKWFKENIADPISSALSDLAKWIWDNLPDWLKSAIEGIKDAITNIPSSINDIVDAIKGIIPDWLEDAIKGIPKAISDLISALKNFFEDPVGTLKSAFEGLAESIWNLLPDWLKSAIQGMQKAWNTFVEGLKDFLEDPAGFVKTRFEELATWIWEYLPDPIKGFFEKAGEFLTTAWDTLVDFFTVKLPNFVSWLSTEFQAFLEDPLGYLKEKVVTPLMQGFSWLWGQISSTISNLINIISTWLGEVVAKATQIGKSLIEKIMNLGTSIAQSLADAGKTIAQAISKVLQGLMEGIVAPLRAYLENALKTVLGGGQGQGQGELATIFGVGIAVVPQYLTVLMLPKFFKTLSHWAREARIRLRARLAPMGVGGSIAVDIFSRLAHAFYELGDAVEDLPEKMGTGFIYGFSLMGLEPLRYPFRYAWKSWLRRLGYGDVPFELPPLEMARNLIQRLGIEEARDTYRRILEYRGFPDWFIENFVKTADELYIKVTDRFDTERRVPLGLLYAQPSLSMLITMMIRDIFGAGAKGLEEFTKWAYRLGLYKDIAYLIYLLHFRYPSPTRLWDFISRGLAGMLWYKPSDEDIKSATEEAKAIGAHPPIAPIDLNFASDKLFSALTSYMKWHDYARFSWISGFTSDNYMIIDTLADIPTKIDIRWMTKWAIFDFMASKEIKLDSPVSDFIKVVENTAKNEKVMMDLTLMCRLLQARGIHPYYVPITAVAESINALADERTLLRTGIINIYEYGAMTYEDIDSLMQSLVIASFNIAYFDIGEGKWKTGYINLPVSFLPAERKLLELRAVIDRYLRVYRDTFSDLEKAYTEYIIESKAVSDKINEVIKTINEAFTKATTEIAGKEFKMSLDDSYVKAVLASWKVARDIYTIRRIRSWVYRVLGWVLYRTAYGYVTEEDAKRVAQTLSSIAKLPKMEADAITRILTEMVGIAQREYQREYIPTPLTLATMSEYIPAVRMFANRVFEAKGVPQEWRSIWLQYIDIRAIVDEVREVQSSVERLYEYFMINTDMFTSFLEVLKPYGYEDRELRLITDKVNLDRWYRAYRELVGTPRELVTMAEYSPLARRLALAEVKKRIDALPIEEEAKEFLYKLWEDYIRIRPVYDEVEREVTELITDYARGALTWEQFNTLLEELKDWGIDEWEADAIRFLAMMRRRRYELTGYLETQA